jgi:hypothetical protein
MCPDDQNTGRRLSIADAAAQAGVACNTIQVWCTVFRDLADPIGGHGLFRWRVHPDRLHQLIALRGNGKLPPGTMTAVLRRHGRRVISQPVRP